MLTISISQTEQTAILALNDLGTLYVPNKSGGVTVRKEFFSAVAGKTVDLEIKSVGALNFGGRIGNSGYATNETTIKAICSVEAEKESTDIRLHLCDIIPALKNGGTAKFRFSVYTPKGQTVTEQSPEKSYLVPECVNRATSTEIADYVSSLKAEPEQTGKKPLGA